MSDQDKWRTVTSRTDSQTGEGVQHPDYEWAKATVVAAKGDRVTQDELDTLYWNPTMGCYLMAWCNMVLGIETDGHIHS